MAAPHSAYMLVFRCTMAMLALLVIAVVVFSPGKRLGRLCGGLGWWIFLEFLISGVAGYGVHWHFERLAPMSLIAADGQHFEDGCIRDQWDVLLDGGRNSRELFFFFCMCALVIFVWGTWSQRRERRFQRTAMRARPRTNQGG